MVTGIGSLVPAFGGFSLSQVVMIFATGWGITFGNYAYVKALDAASSFTPLVNLSAGSTIKVGSNYSELARAIFMQRLCLADYSEKKRLLTAGGPGIPSGDVVSLRTLQQTGLGTHGYSYGTPSDNSSCYTVGLRQNPGGRTYSGLGFREPAGVDYEAIANLSGRRYVSAFNTLYSNLATLADQFVTEASRRRGLDAVTANEIASYSSRIENEAVSFANAINTGASSGETTYGTAIRDQAFADMKRNGFFGAGSYYATYAEMNSAIGAANNSTEVIVGYGKGNDEVAASGDFSYYQSHFQNSVGNFGGGAAQGGSLSCSAGDVLTLLNTEGRCNFGQVLMNFALNVGTSGSSSGGQVGTIKWIDPIIAAKNIGDYFMVAGQTLMAASYWIGETKDDKKSLTQKAVSAVLDVAKTVAPAGGVLSAIAKAFGSMLPTLSIMLLIVGALLSLYIPMVPFITWVSALIQYACIVVESIAAAPLWAFAHLQPDGEGMGQRSERGYLYLLLLLFKPILMVIGFFAACGLIVLMGSVVFALFVPAVASAQGNSFTGLVSIIGYMIIFFVIMNTIIQGLFNLVMDLSDDVIGWIGSVGRSQMGRDTEGKVHNVFMMGGRSMADLPRGAMAASAAAAKDANRLKQGSLSAPPAGSPAKKTR